ncbi:TIGR03085 family metal-binding protein [Nocardioides sp.]|uniref:TIGR03085 family metal-binding protein n=1 Tax=Nocardioides sp. TaxID=35761 RepID=UPI003D0C82D7
MSTHHLAREERQRLCDLALDLGPEAPTLCGDWNVQELVAHLLVRERSPFSVGIAVPQLSGLTERAMVRAQRPGLEAMVARLRSTRFTPVWIGKVDTLLNTMEFFVHHEDIRRAQPEWTPRRLSSYEQAQVWGGLRFTGKALARPAGVPVSIRRSDRDAVAVLVPGDEPVVVTGLPCELTMFLYGRDQHRDLEFTGPQQKIAALKGAALGL